jgi:hypothetical protein
MQMPPFSELAASPEAIQDLQQRLLNAERYAKVRRMDVITFRDISNSVTTYEEFDEKVDAYELL